MTASISILKKSEGPLFQNSTDFAIEKAKNILVDQVMNQSEASSGQLKRLKMSIESLMNDDNKGWSNLVLTKRESTKNKKVKELVYEKSTDDSINHPSFKKTRDTLSQLPRYVLDNIHTDDSNFTVKYVSYYCVIF